MKVAFLIGAGMASVAGMPTTQDITKDVLIQFEENSTTEDPRAFFLRFTNEVQCDLKPISMLLRVLKNEADAGFYNRSDKIANYEDLYYLLDKLPNENDPLVTHFRNKLISQIAPLLLKNDNTKMTLFELTEKSKAFIKQVVCSRININSFNENSSGYQNEEYRANVYRTHEQAYRMFYNAKMDKSVEEVHIFSLNHDLTLENYLQNKNIVFNDGFRKEKNNVMIWKGDSFAFSSAFSSDFTVKTKMNLYKLHGSVDWWESSENGTPVLLKAPDADHIQTWPKKHGSLRFSPNNVSGPIFLTGTINKITEYTQGIFHRLYSLFIDRLLEYDLLIIAGYGFGDEGINHVITNFANNGEQVPGPTTAKKIIIIESDVEKLKRNPVITKMSTHAFPGSGQPKRQIFKTKLKVIPSKIEDITWDMINSTTDFLLNTDEVTRFLEAK